MRIISVQLKNYRQYFGENVIEFSIDPDKNFTIIEGPNGSGKTNLLNALSWCLYGKEPHLSNTSKQRSVSPVNLMAESELQPSQSLDMFVRLVLGETKPEYMITRYLKANRNADGAISYYSPPDSNSPKVTYLKGKDWENHDQPNTLINYLLPESVSGFFFFDGERLDDFFKAENREGVKQAILKVSQIELISKSLEHLDYMKDQLRLTAKGLSSQADTILQQIESARKAMESIAAEQSSLEQRKLEIVNKISYIDEKLKQMSPEGAKQLAQERERLDVEIESSQDEIAELNQSLVDMVVKYGPSAFLMTAVQSTLDEITRKYKAGDLPPKVRADYVKSLLQTGRCICGADISRSGTGRSNIEKQLLLASFSDIDNEVSEGKFELAQILGDLKGFIPNSDVLGKKLSMAEQDVRKKQARSKEISTLLSNYDAETVARLEKDRAEFNILKDGLSERIGSVKNQIEYQSSYLKLQEKDYKKELEKSEKHKALKTKLALCERSITILQQIKDELLEETREVIEAKTKEYFLDLIWKKDTFVDVKIDNNYLVSVIHKRGVDCLGILSAGERQVLALSFMAALKEVSGFDAPVVIDTPMGRISKAPKDNIARCLPRFLSETQVTMLVTEEEYTPSVRSYLHPRIGKEWKLDVDEKNEETKVIPYAT